MNATDLNEQNIDRNITNNINKLEPSPSLSLISDQFNDNKIMERNEESPKESFQNQHKLTYSMEVSDSPILFNNGCKCQCSCIPYKKNNETNKIEILLVKSKSRGDWTFAQGGLEINESKETCALREGWEEAGIKGNIRSLLGSEKGYYYHTKKGIDCIAWYFLVEVTETAINYPESNCRERCWFLPNQITFKLQRKELLYAWNLAKEYFIQYNMIDKNSFNINAKNNIENHDNNNNDMNTNEDK